MAQSEDPIGRRSPSPDGPRDTPPQPAPGGPSSEPGLRIPSLREARDVYIAALALAAIAAHLILRYGTSAPDVLYQAPLYFALLVGGIPLVLDLVMKALHRQFGADLIAGISIVTAVLLGEYLAGTLVVLMLAGGSAIEAYAVDRASSVLRALAGRLPSVAHRKGADGLEDVAVGEIRPGDELVVFPHEIAAVDGEVLEGSGVMDEAYLTGEPYLIAKVPGTQVISGAINGDAALTIRATRPAEDSRYARIMRVVRGAEQNRPRIRRLGDQLGALYTPLAVGIAAAAWAVSGDPVRFLAVMVVATPCPLLIAIPVAVIGAVSRAAQRGIIVRSPAVLEQIPRVRTVILDKTGTLTYGRPALTEELYAPGTRREEVLPLVAAVERYSKHPLAEAVVDAARRAGLPLPPVEQVREPPGHGLVGRAGETTVEVTGRDRLLRDRRIDPHALPPLASGLECVVLVDGEYAATYRFHDAPRAESGPFVAHLGPRHGVERVLLVSGDREAEVRYLAEQVAISEIRAGVSPEEKVEIVQAETRRAPTLFLGDGINDATAMLTATVGVAFGSGEVTAEAAGAVVVDVSLERVDELFHLSARMRRIALQSAVGGMALSLVGMGVAAAGYLPPVAGAVTQELIDLLTIFNALRMAFPPRTLTDF
ncbi:MAG TPA: heavy metal translocating P-type ATPase [Longimicrobium sp.]|nr:heavy metal translocating P-type ATPase [Longimicrobium sp.]